jgi:hypothetical protein
LSQGTIIKGDLGKTSISPKTVIRRTLTTATANDFTKDKNDDNAFIHKFWKTYKKEIDDVNQLNHLYSVLLNSVKEISFVFKYPFDLIENQRGT